MIPLFIVMKIFRPFHPPLRLWLPLFLVWLLLLPFAVIILPVTAVVLSAKRIDPLLAIDAFFEMLCGISGTRLEVTGSRSAVFIHVY
jgi:hypothetical protein